MVTLMKAALRDFRLKLKTRLDNEGEISD